MLGTSQRRLAVRPLQSRVTRCASDAVVRGQHALQHAVEYAMATGAFTCGSSAKASLVNNKRIDRLYRERACRSQSIVPTAGHARVPEAFPEHIRHLIGSLVPEPCQATSGSAHPSLPVCPCDRGPNPTMPPRPHHSPRAPAPRRVCPAQAPQASCGFPKVAVHLPVNRKLKCPLFRILKCPLVDKKIAVSAIL